MRCDAMQLQRCSAMHAAAAAVAHNPEVVAHARAGKAPWLLSPMILKILPNKTLASGEPTPLRLPSDDANAPVLFRAASDGLSQRNPAQCASIEARGSSDDVPAKAVPSAQPSDHTVYHALALLNGLEVNEVGLVAPWSVAVKDTLEAMGSAHHRRLVILPSILVPSDEGSGRSTCMSIGSSRSIVDLPDQLGGFWPSGIDYRAPWAGPSDYLTLDYDDE